MGKVIERMKSAILPTCPKESLKNELAFDVRDWSECRRDAWIYGIVLGWDEKSFAELKVKFGWDDSEATRLKQLHSDFEMLELPKAEDK